MPSAFSWPVLVPYALRAPAPVNLGVRPLLEPAMIDELVPQIEQLQAEGASVLLKWDGERESDRTTVTITRHETDYIWRKDSDDLAQTLQEALQEYTARHAPGTRR